MCRCPETDGRGQRLACQHMRAVQVAVDHTVQQHLPVGLRFQCDEQALILEIAALICDGQGGHIGQFDETECQILDFGETVSMHEGAAKCGDDAGGNKKLADHDDILWLWPECVGPKRKKPPTGAAQVKRNLVRRLCPWGFIIEP